MILTGYEIAAAVADGRVVIDGFDPARVEPNSYGFRLGPDLLIYADAELDCALTPKAHTVTMGPDGYVLHPGRLYLGVTAEAMGSPCYAATLEATRSVACLGMWIQFSAPLGHSGAIFPWTLEITVAHPVRVFPGMTIGKIAFWVMAGTPTPYRGRYTGSCTAVASRLSADDVEHAR